MINISYGVDLISNKTEQRFQIGLDQVGGDIKLLKGVPK